MDQDTEERLRAHIARLEGLYRGVLMSDFHSSGLIKALTSKARALEIAGGDLEKAKEIHQWMQGGT